nr:MAG TPA: DNA directed RNA polymerase, 7 kDa subunit [Caudoviricetes sp.]
MPTSDERHEVARKLRDNLGYMRDNEKWYEYDLDSEKCGNRAYRIIAASVEECGNYIDGNYIHIVETLADLIDPTCVVRMPLIGSVGVCLACGALVETRLAVFSATEALPTRYCPNCGARVVGCHE